MRMKRMNLSNIYKLSCSTVDAISDLKCTESKEAGCVNVSGWLNAKETILKLKELEYFKESCDLLWNSVPSYYKDEKEFSVTKQRWNEILINRNNLHRKIRDVIELYESMGFDRDKSVGLNIKLPNNMDFSDFTNALKDLEFIFTKCPFICNLEEKLQFKNVDIGSTWLCFAIVGIATTGVSMIANNIAALIDKAIIIKSHLLSIEQQEERLKAIVSDREKKEEAMNIVTESYKQMKEECWSTNIEELTASTGVKLADGDEKSRTEQSLKKLGVLIDNGLKIYSSIDAPEEVKILFPPLEIKQVEHEEMKKLENK